MTSRALHFVISADGKGLVTAVGASVSELEKLNKAADKMSEKLAKADGGARAMTVLEASVKKLGGTSQLTAEQLSIVKERLEKLSSIGAKIPDEFAKLKSQMDAAAAAGRALGAAQGELAGKASGLASSMGPLGSVLSSLGPYGLAAAAGLGAVAVAGGAVLGVLEAAVSKAVAFGATFQEMSDNSAVAASKLSLIAGASGMGIEGVEKFTGGLKKLNSELLSADAGPKFAQLGLSVKDLLAMQPEERFAKTAEAILKLGSDAEISAASQELLGKAMPVATLRDFADIQEKMARADKLGLGISDSDAASLKALSDEAKVFTDTWAHLLINLGASIATTPGVIEGLHGITNALGEVNQFIKEHRGEIQTLVGIVVPLWDKMGKAVKAYLDYVKQAKPTNWFGQEVQGNDLGQTPEQEARARKAIADAYKAKANEGSGLKQTTKGPHFDPDAGAKAKAAAEAAAAATAKWWAEQEKLGTASEKAATSLQKVLEAAVGLGESQVAHETEQLGDMLRDAGGAASLTSAQTDKLIKKLKELRATSLSGFGMGTEMFPELRQVASIQEMGIFKGTGKGGKSLGLDQLSSAKGSSLTGPRVELDSTAFSTKSHERFLRQLDEASDGLMRLGHSMGGFAGGLATLAGGVGSAFANARTKAQVSAMSGGDKAAAGVGAAGDIIGIYQEQKHNMSAGGAAMGGAASGAKAGAAFGPYGVVIGAAVGALVGVLSGSGFRKMAKDAGKVLGEEITKETATAVEATKKKLKLGTNEATLLNISGAIGDKDPRRFGKQVIDLMDGIKTGAIPAKEGLEELAKDFGAIADSALKAGSVGDKALVGIIKRSRELGLESPEIKEFVKGQLLGAAGGVNKFVGKFSEDKGDGGKLIGGLDLFGGAQGTAGLAAATDNGKAQATIFSAVFWANVKEQGLVGAADAMKESFGRLKENLTTVFGKDQMAAIFGDVEAMMGLAGNELFRGAAEGAQGLKEALEGVANAGYLTVDSFGAFEQQAGAAFNQAVAGGASSQQALLTIAPLLQSLASAAENYSIPLDDATRSLIEQAKAAGIAFKTDPLERMAEATDRMVVALEKLAGITPKAAAGLNDVANAANNMPSGSGSGGGGSNGYGGYGPGDIPQYADGGYVPPRPGGTIIRVAEAGVGEYITPANRGGGISGSAGGGVSVSVGDIHVMIPPGSSLDPGAVANAVMVAMRDNIGGIASRLASA